MHRPSPRPVRRAKRHDARGVPAEKRTAAIGPHASRMPRSRIRIPHPAAVRTAVRTAADRTVADRFATHAAAGNTAFLQNRRSPEQPGRGPAAVLAGSGVARTDPRFFAAPFFGVLIASIQEPDRLPFRNSFRQSGSAIQQAVNPCRKHPTCFTAPPAKAA